MGRDKEKPGGLCHKSPPNMVPQNNETKIFKSNKKNIYIYNSKDQITGTGRECDGTINTGVIRKSDNPLKVIRNPIPRNPDNPLKGIRNLVPNRIRSQWPRGLTVPT